jgi:hypothetical protein
MKFISHRGNLKGRKPDLENRPSYIDSAIQLGYEVEIDVRYEKGLFQLGHDTSDYTVDFNWLEKRIDYLWLHCKDIASAQILSDKKHIKHFCHVEDPYVIMSTGHIWVHDIRLDLNDRCIIPLLGLEDIQHINLYKDKVYAVCTDYCIF